jgi:hypothetical protein
MTDQLYQELPARVLLGAARRPCRQPVATSAPTATSGT